MATREVLFSICDRCGAEEQTDTALVSGKPGPKGKTLLPAGWIFITAKSAFVKDVVSMDLCTQCAKQQLRWLQPAEYVEAREGE